MPINYTHSANLHTLAGPQSAWPYLFRGQNPSSLLDVGCGTGTWLKAAQDFGVRDVLGVEGAQVSPDSLHVSTELIRHQDLTLPWDLSRRFDVVICLEVAEHLDASFSSVLIDSLVRHGDRVVFSAACPGQPGQHHVNCQWPAYWQRLFNGRGYVCEDNLRWEIWNEPEVEPWYRQNLFLAVRDIKKAGTEPRICGVMHPEIFLPLQEMRYREGLEQGKLDGIKLVKNGFLSFFEYVTLPLAASFSKLRRRFLAPTNH